VATGMGSSPELDQVCNLLRNGTTAAELDAALQVIHSPS
jgi:hypothetical protein